MKSLAALVITALVVAVIAAATSSAHALELSPRRIEVSGAIDARAGAKLASDLMKLDEAGAEPIYLLVTASGGSAQGVMVVADAIKALESPVVAVVLTPVQGAGAALPLFADRVVMLPSAQLVLTEVDYEGVAKPTDPKDVKPDAKPPTKGETFLQKVRADYLAKFWGLVGKRLGAGAGLQGEIEAQGGRVIGADEALQKKIAFEIVTSLDSPAVPQEKVEVKTTTTRTTTKTLPPEKAPARSN